MEKAGRGVRKENSMDRMQCYFMGWQCKVRFNHNFSATITHIPGYDNHPVNPVHLADPATAVAV